MHESSAEMEINMDTYSLTQKEYETLYKMNADSQKYGRQSLEPHKLSQFNYLGTEYQKHPLAEENRKIAGVLLDQMIVDVQSAEALKDAYPDLYEHSRNEVQRMQSEANVSGVEKVKKDFFGRKRRLAKEAVRKLENDREQLRKGRQEEEYQAEELEYRTNAYEYMSRYKEECEKVEDGLKQNANDPALILKQQLLNPNGRMLTPVLASELLNKISDSSLAIRTAQDAFLSKEYTTKDGRKRKLSANCYYRDMAGYTTALGRGMDADVDTMEKHARNVEILITGKTIEEEEVNEDGIRKACQEEIPVVQLAYDECQDFFHAHPELLQKEIPASTIMANLDEIQLFYKKTQVVAYVTKEMVKDSVLQLFSEEEQEHIRELRKITAAMNDVSLHLHQSLKNYAEANTAYNEDRVYIPIKGKTLEEYFALRKRN